MNNNKMIILLPFLAFALQMQAEEASDSVIYSNHIVSTDINISTRKAIQVKSVTVTPKGNLRLMGMQGVTLDQNLLVQPGGTFVIQTGKPPRIKYSYDACGNRIKREKK